VKLAFARWQERF